MFQLSVVYKITQCIVALEITFSLFISSFFWRHFRTLYLTQFEQLFSCYFGLSYIHLILQTLIYLMFFKTSFKLSVSSIFDLHMFKHPALLEPA